MQINYKHWFDEYNQYRRIEDGDKVGYNDTTWVNINNKYNSLIKMKSNLLELQPFNVVGNENAFDNLIDMMNKSNYSFDDIDDSLMKTYKKSLQASMSNMVVNSHAVMFHCTSDNERYVSMNNLSSYYIIDAPFNQIHFGERDEFIRQQLQKMYATGRDNFIPLSEFVTSEITDLLGFSIICSVNGYICNDTLIAIDDKGLRFKINWPYSGIGGLNTPLHFIIYKIDVSHVIKCKVDISRLESNGFLSLKELGLDNHVNGNNHCIIDIYDENYKTTGRTVPNFGIINSEGLFISKIQQFTRNQLTNQRTKDVTLIIYETKYLHEVPNVYPAMNYFDVIDERRVYEKNGNMIDDVKGNHIISTSEINPKKFPICTPPIAIDRDITVTFSVLRKCMGMLSYLKMHETTFKNVGTELMKPIEILAKNFESKVRNPLRTALPALRELFSYYAKGAMLTSQITIDRINRFETLINKVSDFIKNANVTNVQKYVIDEFYNDNYDGFCTYITEPFRNTDLAKFNIITQIGDNYFEDSTLNSVRFRRPISEQCFITLKYSRADECWLFHYPNIEHFKGIGNTFYIKDELQGDEIFKFFILYTDTDSPSELTTNPLSLENVFDFDKFCEEVNHHLGYIKYWQAENKLMKISKVLYNTYDDEHIVYVLSKILNQEINADDILHKYGTEISYDRSNVTTLNWEDYDNKSEQAPFAINFLFYTLSMMNKNVDKLQSYLFKDLVDKKFDSRYVDVNIEGLIDRSMVSPVNYSKFSIAPNEIDFPHSNIDPLSYSTFYGIPLEIKNYAINSKPYRFTFNCYKNDYKYPLITSDDLSLEYYMSYGDLTRFNSSEVSFANDINIAKLSSKYLSYVYTYISELQSRYIKSYDIRSDIERCENTVYEIFDELRKYTDDMTYFCPQSYNVSRMIVDYNPFINRLDTLKAYYNSLYVVSFNGKRTTFRSVIDGFLKLLKQIYTTIGFENGVTQRCKKLYLDMKKINKVMNLYEFGLWVNNIDLYLIRNLYSCLAENENFNISESIFNQYYNFFNNYKTNANAKIELINELITEDLFEVFYNDHFKPIIDYCEDIYQNYIVDLFMIKNVKQRSVISLTSKPYIGIITVGSYDNFNAPAGITHTNDETMLFKINSHQEGSNWIVDEIIPICDYVSFKDTQINNIPIKLMDDNGNVISTKNVNIVFTKVGNTSDFGNDIEILPNVSQTLIDFNNEHETFNINNKNIINDKTMEMHFELLFGNRYAQLNHENEYVLNPDTYEEHSIQRVFVPNKLINDMMLSSHAKTVNSLMYFKPSQIMHPDKSDTKIMISVGGKYFVGQTLYLTTIDGLLTFPVKVTAIDHSTSHGFVEAVVDTYNAKWFGTSDMEVIDRYMRNTITCYVLDDNISNFVDEFTHSSYKSYSIPQISEWENTDIHTLPGDPVFVTNNQKYTYTRLSYFFNEEIPNRFIDDSSKTLSFRFVDEISMLALSDDRSYSINLVNRDLSNLSDPEKYPVLRTEPNDHDIWEQERVTFTMTIADYNGRIKGLEYEEKAIRGAIAQARTEAERRTATLALLDVQSKIDYWNDRINSIQHYRDQLEIPTTWYNVKSYNSALTYMDNGRAEGIFTYDIDKRDLLVSDKINVFLYDWQHKEWINPSKYDISWTIIDGMKLDEKDDYRTNNIMKKLVITPNDDSINSTSVFIYFVYDTSDIFEDLPINDKTCQVRFKPLLSTGRANDDFSYSNIKIRKHFDGIEKYDFEEFNGNDHSFEDDGLYVKRYERNGLYVNAPRFRFKDLSIHNGDDVIPCNECSLYVKMPFNDTKTNQKYLIPKYEVIISQDIENPVIGETVKLISISNNDKSSYDGNISTVMFEGVLSGDESSLTISITKSTLPSYVTGTFVCTTFQSNDYKATGGVVVVIVTNDSEDIVTSNGEWLQIRNEDAIYHELDDEFIITTTRTLDFTKPVSIMLNNIYEKEVRDDIDLLNTGIDNPLEFYYNDKELIRYPISNVLTSNPNERLVIDKTLNDDVSIAKMTYLGVCRYSLHVIPKDGVIDVTGYIPTPLSRNRYEFWVNGRMVNDTNVTILSPTSFQLHNLKSLKNFELIELVDDVLDSSIMNRGYVYLDINGKTYSSFKLAVLSKSSMIDQSIRYVFNTNNHTKLDDYTRSISNNPNNENIETDILDTVSIDTSSINSYKSLYNLPSINGIQLYNTKIKNLGMNEIPIDDIIKMMDETWKDEIITNPLFGYTHYDCLKYDEVNSITLHVKDSSVIKETGMDITNTQVIYASGISDDYFTLYISNSDSGHIDDPHNTIRIIPFIKVGIYVLIDKSYTGKWLHSTDPRIKPIRL